MGELLRYYAAADVAFVGGSLVEIGGHNVLEAAAQAVPVVVGPNTFNFTEITQSLLEADAAVRVADADALGPTVQRLLGDAADRQRRGAAARAVFERERGAVERSMAIIDRVLAGDAPGA